jgi:hypothetical protein
MREEGRKGGYRQRVREKTQREGKEAVRKALSIKRLSSFYTVGTHAPYTRVAAEAAGLSSKGCGGLCDGSPLLG